MIENNLLDFIQDNIKSYIDDKTASNLSKNTILTYTRILERFYDYLADELVENEFLSLKDINKYFLNGYVIYLQNNSLSKKSQALHMICIKNFMWFIADSDIREYKYLKENITSFKIKTEQKEKESFSEDDQKRIVDYINLLDRKNTFLSNRNSLLIKLLFYTGVRISELLSIKWTDLVEYDEYYEIIIMGKGSKERKTYLSKELTEINIDFLAEDKSKGIYLISSGSGQQCSRTNLFKIVNGLLAKAGVVKQGLHIFRHTLARNLVKQNYNLSTIKEVLGHSSINTTAQFYAKADENAKKNALLKLKNNFLG